MSLYYSKLHTCTENCLHIFLTKVYLWIEVCVNFQICIIPFLFEIQASKSTFSLRVLSLQKSLFRNISHFLLNFLTFNPLTAHKGTQ